MTPEEAKTLARETDVVLARLRAQGYSPTQCGYAALGVRELAALRQERQKREQKEASST